MASKWTLVWDETSDDHYVGRDAALYRDGELVWSGHSDDEAEELVRAIVGDDLVVLVGERRPADQWGAGLTGRWASRLSDVASLTTRRP